MKIMILPLLSYIIVCLIVVLFPASEGYDTFGWKLLIGQIYAIPALIIFTLISIFWKRKKSRQN